MKNLARTTYFFLPKESRRKKAAYSYRSEVFYHEDTNGAKAFKWFFKLSVLASLWLGFKKNSVRSASSGVKLA